MQYFSNLPTATVKEAIRSNSRTIVSIKKEAGVDGEVYVKALLVKIFKGVITFFNVGKSMNDSQVAELVGFVATDYYFLKLADLKVWADGFKKGKYLSFSNGKLFDRLDGQIILMSLTEYCEERFKECETVSIEKHSEQKALEQDEKRFIIKVGENYLRENTEDVEEVKEKEMATCFDFKQAMKVKTILIRDVFPEQPESVKIIDKNKAAGGFFLANAEPTKKEIKRASIYEYNLKIKAINMDDSLTEFEKYNKRRAVAGLKPDTEKEFEELQKLLKQQNQ